MGFLTNMFPKKVKTLGEFIRIIAQEKIPLISITPLMDNNFNAILVHEARNNKGRKIVYREVITIAEWQPPIKLAVAVMPRTIRRENIKLCLTGEQRIKALKRKLTNTDIHLIFEGETMTSFEDLHQKAKAEGVF